ncbi:MAG: glycosyltransferase family 39 protein [Microgenomates group bacterium]
MKNKFHLEVIIIAIFTLLYFASRLQNLTAIPVFGDEAIYLRWSQIIKSVDTLRFIPQTDGKQPLFMWLTVILYKFVHDPLTAGRLVSVFSGYLNLATIYFICRYFFSWRLAILSSILYLCLPFTFFFDRLALPDNLLSTLGTLSLLFSLLLAKYPRLDLAFILGTLLGLAWLTKSPAIYFITLSLFTFIFFRPDNYKKIYLPLASILISVAIYNILRLGPQFGQIALRNRDYIWSLSELIHHPFDPFVPHLKDLLIIYWQYLTWPIIFISFFGLISRFRKLNQTHFIIFCWFILPLLANLAIAKVFTARYILFTIPPLIILLTATLSYFNNYLLLLIFIPSLFFNYQISTSPFKTKLYISEAGYLKSWTSGWGIEPAARYLIQRSLVANVIVGTEGYFGTLPDGLQIYTNQLSQLTVFGVGIDIVKIPEKLLDARNHGDEVYLLFNKSRLRLPPSELVQLTLITAFDKPDGDQLLLLKLN